ncbi:MAG: hypothetical protein QM621_06375 [Aeromicrobium sp.]|uniref:hypothetical protein n=1 Tax=Aeromicrobium sp. TaxID=1871063 RepID=UPI0039E4F5C4
MARPTSLAFRALDAQVIAGRGEEVALRDADGCLTTAQLLHESAVVAGAWRLLGLQEGDGLRLDVSRRHEVIAVLAALRLQLDCGAPAAPALLAGRPPVVSLGGEDVPWDALIQLGRTDPLPAPAVDAPFVEAWASRHDDLLAPLLRGEEIVF